MARTSVQSRKLGTTFRVSESMPGIIVEPEFYFSPPKGLNTFAPVNRLPKEFSPYMKNWILDQGTLVSRPGLVAVGEAVAGTIMATFSFKAPDSSGRVFRLLTTRMEQWNGTSWGPVADVVFTGTTTDRFTWTGFGNELLICNGVDKIVAFNVVTGVVEVLEESVPCRHLATFNNRVWASAVTEGAFLGYRTRWSVKNDHRDWTSQTTTDGVGGGFEDLFGGTDGYVDQIMGVYSLSDDTALMVREDSLWLAFVTGDVMAPHRFSRLPNARVGSRARHSIRKTPFGIVLLTKEDVVVASQGGFESIGQAVRRELLASITDFDAVSSVYDSDRQEYRLIVGSRVWRWSFVDKGWTRDEYPFDLRAGEYFDYQSLGLTFDELTGTFDELQGTFDELVRDFEDKGVHYIVAGQEVVAGEEVGSTQDLGEESGLEIRSNLLQAASIIDKTEIVEAQLEYEADVSQELLFDYSYNRGTTWQQYSKITVGPTQGPDLLQVRRTLTSRSLMIRVRTVDLGKTRLHSLILFVNKAARENP